MHQACDETGGKTGHFGMSANRKENTKAGSKIRRQILCAVL